MAKEIKGIDAWKCNDCAGGPCVLNCPGTLVTKDGNSPSICPYGNDTDCAWLPETSDGRRVMDVGLIGRWWSDIPKDRRPYGSDLWKLIRLIGSQVDTTGYTAVPDKQTYSVE